MSRRLTLSLLGLAVCLSAIALSSRSFSAPASKKPHAVFVVGTGHYNPGATLPPLAKQLEQFGFRTTIVKADYNPEKNPKGLPGLEALKDADVAVFYMRFLTLPDDQLALVKQYVESGKPVVGFRTSTHAFAYGKDSKHAKWNDAFGKDVLGSRYFIHLAGSSQISAAPKAKQHPILTGVDLKQPRTAAGTLYLSEVPKDATVLLTGTGNSKREGTVTNRFGTHELKKTMTDDVAWTWTNQWGGRVFTTTLGHPSTFGDANFVRLFVNGIHWAAGKPVPSADTKVAAFSASMKHKDSAKKRTKATAVADKKAADKADRKKRDRKKKPKSPDAKHTTTGKKAPPEDPDFAKYAIYAKTAPHAKSTTPVETALPLKLDKGARIALIGNTLLDRAQHFGQFEAMLQQSHPGQELVVRNLAWSADTADIQPRPANFASVEQHLAHEKADVIFAAFGFNESFAGEKGLADFHKKLSAYVAGLKSKAFNGKNAPQIVLVSPIANENIPGVPAADLNNKNIKLYADVVKKIAAEQKVGFVDVYAPTLAAMEGSKADMTINGVHLNKEGYSVFAKSLFKGTFAKEAPKVNEQVRQTVLDKNRQYFRRYRPANTFYYTGGRNKSYGYLDFLPAMRNFDIMTANRDQRIWALAQGKKVPAKIDDSNVPPLPKTKESRGANRWKTAADELKDFKIDPRFEVTLFAGEEEFPDIAAPIQMRWDSKGRLWVACSTTYPHVYPGNEPNDKLVILEDTDGDGKADKSTVFADDLHIPLSFEFGDGGVYVSEMPDLTFIKDTDGDGKADYRRRVLTGFGTEDSHHSLHDIAWTPDGDLIFREAVFHHSQVETPYGPVRQQNSGWFRYQPRNHRLTSFGTYSSTNPWGVTFDDWGQHMASHPVFASAFHALDPPYPQQHPRPAGLQAYSGVCGQEFVDFDTFPDGMKGNFIKVRYKPTNRVEIHKWIENDFGYNEQYVGDLLFSKNLSFIPVDLRYGPRGAMYVCDWYNPVKGHAQYSLRDERRDRHSGRIWRIVGKGKKLADPPKIDGASTEELLELLKLPQYRYRYWAKRELRAKDADEVKKALDKWVADLDRADSRFRHHQIEAIWTYRNIDRVNAKLLREVLSCDVHNARAAATRQLRYWHAHMPDAIKLLRTSANDPNGLVRMEAAIAATYIGSKPALDAMLDVLKYPAEKHLKYAITTSLGSHTMRRHWEGSKNYNIAKLLKKMSRTSGLKEPTPTAKQAQFDSQKDLKTVRISCIPERMMFSVRQFAVKTGQPVKLVFVNGDATDHNLVIVKPGKLAEVGMAANDMAKDPKNANSDFIPPSKKDLILAHSPMIGPTRKDQVHVMRFNAPTEPGIYPFVCTFPGHWVMMTGEIVVANDLKDVKAMLAARKPTIIKEWTMEDFADLKLTIHDKTFVNGMAAFVKGRCNQCHIACGKGTNLGPELTDVVKRYKGSKLLQQMLEPSSEINEKYRNYQFVMDTGKVITGVVTKETPKEYHVVANLMLPEVVTKVPKDGIDEKNIGKVSPMPPGMLNNLTKEEILDLLAFLESGGLKVPEQPKK